MKLKRVRWLQQQIYSTDDRGVALAGAHRSDCLMHAKHGRGTSCVYRITGSSEVKREGNSVGEHRSAASD